MTAPVELAIAMTGADLMRGRYQRASRFAPALFVAGVNGLMGDGYWIDDRRYFFCLWDIEAGWLPRILDAPTGEIHDAIPREELRRLIGATSDDGQSGPELRAAEFQFQSPTTLIVLLDDKAYHIDVELTVVEKVEPLSSTAMIYSPDGRHACFRSGHALWVRDLATGHEEQLTPDGEANYSFGANLESGVAPLADRRCPVPFGLWSRDSKWFVTHRIDERALPESSLLESDPAKGQYPVRHTFKVSLPGKPQARAEYFAWRFPGRDPVDFDAHGVLAQVVSPFALRQCWLVEDEFYFLDWEQGAAEVALRALHLETGNLRTIRAEATDAVWLDLHPEIAGQPLIRPLPGSGELIFYSQSSGYGHLYLHDLADGSLKNPITEGEWVVREILHVDEERRRILLLASGFEPCGDPTHRSLCAVNFDGSGFEILLKSDCDIEVRPDLMSSLHQISPYRPSYASGGVSSDGRFVIATQGAVDKPTRVCLFDLENYKESTIAAVGFHGDAILPEPWPFEVLAADGVTKLSGALIVPSDFHAGCSYPLVDYIYPGPQINWLSRRFPSPAGLILQTVAELGMVGMILETRGMPQRGRDFHQAGAGRLLEPQLSDHAAAIEQLCRKYGFLDRTRVGIFGHSGGGHAAARAMFDYPQVYRAGAAICGNHDCRNYLAYWIDRYCGPDGSPERDEQSNLAFADRLQGKLLLMHGDMDDNVHPGHTLALSAALIKAGKHFEQLILPGVSHAVLSESPYALRRLWDFLVVTLLGEEPARDFHLSWTDSQHAAVQRLLPLKD